MFPIGGDEHVSSYMVLLIVGGAGLVTCFPEMGAAVLLSRTIGQGCLPGLRATSVKTWFRRAGVRVEVVRHGGGVLGRHNHQQVLPWCVGGLES